MSNNKKILIASIIAVVIASLGIAYGAFTYTRSGTYTSKLVAGDIYMRYKDNNKEINLENAMPSSSYTGGDYFEFEIIGKNTSTKTIYYELLLNHGDVPTGKTEENRIADEFLKFKLVEVNNDTEGNDLLTNTQIYTIDKERIYVGTIGTTNNYTKTYRLYCWIDNSLVIGEDYTQSEWNNLFASIGVDVKGDFTVKTVPTYTLITYNANGGILKPSKKQIETTATTYGLLAEPTKNGYEFDGWYTAENGGTKIESTTSTNGNPVTDLYAHWGVPLPTMNEMCPDCVFVGREITWYTVWNTDGVEPTVLLPQNWTTLGIKENYNDLISEGKNYFLGMKLNNNYQITNSYTCGVENGNAFCIEAYNGTNEQKKQAAINIGETFYGPAEYSESPYLGISYEWHSANDSNYNTFLNFTDSGLYVIIGYNYNNCISYDYGEMRCLYDY